MNTTQGKVTLVGAGPGDPDLLTIKALKAIKAATTNRVIRIGTTT